MILSIETSTAVCSVAIHNEGKFLGGHKYELQNAHSSLLPVTIDQLMSNVGTQVSDLQAVAVSSGPGSYTGLRIGTATAKAIAYSKEIPLISISSLDSLFFQAVDLISVDILCPMIDARRMEVYCYLRRPSGEFLWETKPLIVDENTFQGYIGQKIVLIGAGAGKFKGLFKVENIRIAEGFYPTAESMGALAFEKFNRGIFEDLAYFEPEYLKDFRTKLPL